MDKSQLKRYANMREIPSEDANAAFLDKNALIGAELLSITTDSGNVSFYDLNALPKHLHEQYDKDNVSGNRPAIEGYAAAVWTRDFVSWRTFYLTGKPRPFF